MTYSFGDFIGLLVLGWVIAFVVHQVIGGFLGLFWRGVEKRNRIVVDLKEQP